MLTQLLLVLAVQAQADTAISQLSSDTVYVGGDSTLVDSTPQTQARLDTVGWDYQYQVTPGDRVNTFGVIEEFSPPIVNTGTMTVHSIEVW